MTGCLTTDHISLVSCRVCAMIEMQLVTGGADEEPCFFFSTADNFECVRCQAQANNKDKINSMEEFIKQQAEEIKELQLRIDTLRRIGEVEKELDTAESTMIEEGKVEDEDEEVIEEGKQVEDKDEEEKEGEEKVEDILERKTATPILFVGDSIVRNLQINNSEVKKEVKKICKPGGKVENIHKTIKWNLVENKSLMDPDLVVVHVGTNDTSYRQTETIKDHFMDLHTEVKKKNKRLVVSGPLPTYNRGCNSFSRILALHTWLANWTEKNDIGFVNNFDSFWERKDLFKRDGLHPNKKGSTVLSANIEKFIDKLL